MKIHIKANLNHETVDVHGTQLILDSIKEVNE